MNARTQTNTAAQNAVQHWIGGNLTAGAGQRRQDVFNPATGEVTAQVVLATPEDIGDAVASAKRAFPAWANTSPLRRARVMTKFLNLLNEHTDALAAVITESTARCSATRRAKSRAASRSSSSPAASPHC